MEKRLDWKQPEQTAWLVLRSCDPINWFTLTVVVNQSALPAWVLVNPEMPTEFQSAFPNCVRDFCCTLISIHTRPSLIVASSHHCLVPRSAHLARLDVHWKLLLFFCLDSANWLWSINPVDVLLENCSMMKMIYRRCNRMLFRTRFASGWLLLLHVITLLKKDDPKRSRNSDRLPMQFELESW